MRRLRGCGPQRALATGEGQQAVELARERGFAERAGRIFSWSGLRVTATCKGGALEVFLKDERGKPIADDRTLVLATSDFLASGGDGAIGRLKLPDGAVVETAVIIREAIAAELGKRGGTIDVGDLFNSDQPRLAYPPPRPVKCGASTRPPP